MGELIRRFGLLGIERVTIERPVTLDELKGFAAKFGQLEKTLSGDALKEAAAQLDSDNIRVGRVALEDTEPQESHRLGRRSARCTRKRCRSQAWCGKARGAIRGPIRRPRSR